MPKFADRCCNPFEKPNHRKNTSIRRISANQLQKIAGINEGSFICSSCRKQIDQIKTDSNSAGVSQENEEQVIESNSYIDSVSRENDEKYSTDSSDSSHSESQSSSRKKSKNEEHYDNCEVLKKLFDKFNHPQTTAEEKFQILTLSPDSWSSRKVAQFFGCSRRLTQKAKFVLKTEGVNGIMPKAQSKPGKKLSTHTENLVKNFFENDEYSRILPGKKDFISVKQLDGTREHVQKRLVLCNLKELYEQFKSAHPNEKVGFSKFSQLRPKHCVLAGQNGTHVVCVCVYHQNVKLMIDCSNISTLTNETDMHLVDYKECLKFITCSEAKLDCYYNKCSDCPDVNILKKHLIEQFDRNNIETVQYQAWSSTDRASMITQILPVEEFIDELCTKLIALKTHHYIAKQQAAYIKWRKENLSDGEILVQCDFSENYAFVAQDAAQSFHWNNNQASIHTAICYYKVGTEIRYETFAIISNDLNHDTTSVYASQQLLMEHFKQKLTLKKVIYFTDGAGQHYKNKYNFINLLNHEKDFGVSAEWHFFATAHGKGPGDGIGGNLKRLAMRASLQRSSATQILTPETLYAWAKNALKVTNILFSSKESHEDLKNTLAERFSTATTISGTLGYHSFVPLDENTFSLRRCSSDQDEFKYVMKKTSRSRAVLRPTTPWRRAAASEKGGRIQKN